jgi:hypothetical protein
LLNKFKAKLNSELRLAKVQYNLSSPSVVSILLFPFFFLIFQLILTLPNNYKYILLFWGENKAFENIQFSFFLIGALLSLRIVWLTKMQLERPIVWGFYLIFFLLLFFIAMEEIAWGQQFLQFKTPELIKSFNAQNEFTLHNVEILQRRSDILNFAFSIVALAGVYLSRQKEPKNLAIPRVLFPWVLLIFTLSTLGVINDLVSINQQIDFSLHKQTETVELLIAMGSFLFLSLNTRLFSQKYIFWKDIADVKLRNKHLSVSDVEGRQVSVPLSRFSWLAEASETKQKKWHLGGQGDCIHWPQLEEEVYLQDLLNTSIPREAKEKLASQQFEKGYLLINTLGALASFLWLAILPSDPENNFLFGYSGPRMLMLVASLTITALVFRGWQRLKTDEAWLDKSSKWLHKVLFADGRSWISLVLSVAGILGSLIFLVISLVHADPYIRGILSRLASWAFLSLVISAQIFYYIIRKYLHQARSKMAHAQKLAFSKDRLNIELDDQRKISLPIGMYPILAVASNKDRKNYEFVADGLRVRWPAMEENICIQQFLMGKGSFDPS